MDIVERVKQSLRDNIEAALPSNIVIDYDYPARAALEAAGASELVEALEVISRSADHDDGWTSNGHERCTEYARTALAQYKGE